MFSPKTDRIFPSLGGTKREEDAFREPEVEGCGSVAGPGGSSPNLLTSDLTSQSFSVLGCKLE